MNTARSICMNFIQMHRAIYHQIFSASTIIFYMKFYAVPKILFRFFIKNQSTIFILAKPFS